MRYKKITDFDLIERFLKVNFSSPTHWPEWNLLVSKYYNTVFYYFGLFEKGILSGICPIHERKSGLVKNLNSGQFHYIPYGGWLLSREMEIDPSRIPIPLNASYECFALPSLKEFGTKYLKTNKSFFTLIIDLRKSEDEIWSGSINSKRRNMIRKSVKIGIKVKTGGTLYDFYKLFSENDIQHNLVGLPLNFFEEFIKGSDNVNFIPFVAYQKEVPCSALGLIYDKDYAFYWLGAKSQTSENLGQGDLLQWSAIRHSKLYGCKYYDLCYIEKERLPNIYEFKKGFSNVEAEIPFIKRKKIMFKLLNKLQK